MRKAIVALLFALTFIAGIASSPAAVTTVSTTFTITAPTAAPSLAPPPGSTYCQIQLYGPSANAYLSPQQSNDTYVWVPMAMQPGISLTQGPGVYYGTLLRTYFRFVVSQVNFPGITGLETCSNAAPQPVYNGMDAIFDILTVTTLNATNVNTTNLVATNITQVGQSGCASYTAGVLTGGGGTCLTGSFPPSPTPLPSPTSANANCAFALVTLTCTTPTPLPSPSAVFTGCGIGAWTGLSITVNTTGCASATAVQSVAAGTNITLTGTALNPVVNTTAAPSFGNITNTNNAGSGNELVCVDNSGLERLCSGNTAQNFPAHGVAVLVNSTDGCGSFQSGSNYCNTMGGDCTTGSQCGFVATGHGIADCVAPYLASYVVVGTGGGGQTTPVETGWIIQPYISFSSNKFGIAFENLTGSTFTNAAGHALAAGYTCMI